MCWKERLKSVLYDAVNFSLKGNDKAIIAFSGGVDSTLLAKICQDLKKKLCLVTIGFHDSHDMQFSKKISGLLPFPHDHLSFEVTEPQFREHFRYVRSTMTCNNISHIENCIAFLHLSKALKGRNLGFSFATANGLDELFCGYDKYRLYFDGGDESVSRFMDEKLKNEFHLMNEIRAVTSANDVIPVQPFLTQDFIDFAKQIPLKYKIHGHNDLLRKHIIREVALEVGVPIESAMYPKKALQYGSLIHKYLKKHNKIA
ncbi:MAG: asparagine synthase-related protein [Thermoproteota archaeon]|nr:asparagine synthase-related protein [Thermoproteota archaeon]